MARRMGALRFLLVAAIAGAAVPAMAQTLSNEEISALIAGKKVFLSTPYGLDFPLFYGADGAVSGDASGFTLARMFTPKETGSWWVEGGRMCQKWPSWYDGRTFCFSITQTGPASISWLRDDGLRGTARIEG